MRHCLNFLLATFAFSYFTVRKYFTSIKLINANLGEKNNIAQYHNLADFPFLSPQPVMPVLMVPTILGNEEECMRKHNVTGSFAEDEEREDKCVLACFMKEQHIMNEEGHMIKEKMLEFFEKVEGDHPHEECREAVIHCVDSVEKETDDCETAYKFDVCVNEKETNCALDE